MGTCERDRPGNSRGGALSFRLVHHMSVSGGGSRSRRAVWRAPAKKWHMSAKTLRTPAKNPFLRQLRSRYSYAGERSWAHAVHAPLPLVCLIQRASTVTRASCMNKRPSRSWESNSSDPVHLPASVCALSADKRSARSHASSSSSSYAERTPISLRPMQILLDVMAQTILTKFRSFMRHGI